MKKNGFSRCAEKYIGILRKEGRFATAHVYANALFSFKTFCGTPAVSFRQINSNNLYRYSQYLNDKHLLPNTISTYMRMLRSIYNRGVRSKQAPYIYDLFHNIYTSVKVNQKKALPTNELHKLLYSKPPTETLVRTQQIASLIFQFCGMSFADFAHLDKSALNQNMLRYNRIKTGTPMSLEVLDTAQELISKLKRNDSPTEGNSDYLFAILNGNNNKKSKSEYRNYQYALRKFNDNLKKLARFFGLTSKVTSYSLRHSWATTAKHRGVPIEMISESLGHKSIKTTQIYLKGFELEEMTKVNKMNMLYVKNAK